MIVASVTVTDAIVNLQSVEVFRTTTSARTLALATRASATRAAAETRRKAALAKISIAMTA
jgi:hypothetical protein